MAYNCTISPLEAMDYLWFHQIIVFSVPSSLLIQKALQAPIPISETLPYSSSNTSELSLPEEDISSTISAVTPSEDDSNSQHNDDDDEKEENKLILKQPTRLNPTRRTSWSHSSSPLSKSHKKRLRSYSGSIMRLQKTMSCKTSAELELEEVKGFIDLGFKFDKEHLNPRVMSVVPGLQRIGSWDHEDGNGTPNFDELVEEEGQGEEEKGVMRPYLSESWIVGRTESPLLGIRLPRVSGAADIKKHIRCWARIVASVIRQES